MAAQQATLFPAGNYISRRVAPADKNQQFTPSWIADFARGVFDGGIELDPTSSAIANESIGAARFYTADDDALTRSWAAKTVFFNPPYGRRLIGPMIAKFIQELPDIDQAIVLVNSGTTTAWYGALLKHCDAFLLPRRRISFWTAEGCTSDPSQRLEFQRDPPGGNRYDQTLFYFGSNHGRFALLGSDFGVPCRAIKYAAN